MISLVMYDYIKQNNNNNKIKNYCSFCVIDCFFLKLLYFHC